MRSIVTVLFASLVITSGCEFIKSPKPLEFKNSRSTAVADQLIVFTRAEIETQTGPIAKGKYITFKKPTGIPLVIQFDDLDGDGRWDEAAFLYDLDANQKVTFKPEITDAPATVKAVVRAHVRHIKKNADDTFGAALDVDTMPVNAQPTDFSKVALPPYLTEGPAWENDKVGFRLYFDVRNGKDIWGKRTTQMVLDEVGKDTAKNYHQLADWGMDILKVGASLGAGSLALQFKLDNGEDTLVRLGGKNMEQVTYEKVADGPVRAICRIKYANWKVAAGMEPVTVVEEFHIWGGQYFYESRVTVTNAPKDALLVTGIVNLYNSSLTHYDDTEHKFKSIYTYGVQSENKDNLGMAIAMPASQFEGYGIGALTNSDIKNTNLIRAHITKDQPVRFRFYAAWERSDNCFTSREKFEEFITNDVNF